MSALLFDTETTGIDAPEVIQAAWMRLSDPVSLHVEERWDGGFKPSKPISLGAMATHHIMDEDLAACPPSASFALPGGVEYLIGHNIDYDWKAIGEPPVKRICTLALCRSLFPQADSHTQGAMLYLLERSSARMRLKNAHDAAYDVTNCHLVLGYVLKRLNNCETWEALWQASEKARVPTVMAFGKHRGMAIKDLPPDYRAWMLRQADVDPYLVKALKAAGR